MPLSHTSYLKIVKCLVLVTLFYSFQRHFEVTGQREEDYPQRPDRCQAPTDVMYRQCCILPPFFTRDIAKTCGALLTLNFIQGNITGFTRRTVSRCKHWKCVLEKYDMLTPAGRVDDEKYFIHLDKWVELNPAFANVMLNAKINCKLSHRHIMPLDPCEFYNFHGCIRNYINLDCPVYLNTPQCTEVKEFNAECKEFFTKK